jgi:hypothetical protein
MPSHISDHAKHRSEASTDETTITVSVCNLFLAPRGDLNNQFDQKAGGRVARRPPGHIHQQSVAAASV